MNSVERVAQRSLVQQLHALARGEVSAVELTQQALRRISGATDRSFTEVCAELAMESATASDRRRATGSRLGRLDGATLAIDDSFHVQGLPTGFGIASPVPMAVADAGVVSRLRGAGAVILGKTAIDEAGFGTIGHATAGGPVINPRDPSRVAGGASAGAAAAVSAGHVAFALAADTLGAARIPAAFCGVVAMRPTHGELSAHGQLSMLRRLDTPALIVRCVQDAGLLLPLLAGYDPLDPRSRKRRVPLAPPDWMPGQVRAAVVSDLGLMGCAHEVQERFAAALSRVAPLFGSATPLSLEIAPLDVAATRRASLLLLEAELLAAHGDRLQAASPRLQNLLAYAERKSAADLIRADRRLDVHVVQVRRIFESFDVVLLPTVPSLPPLLGSEEPANLADFTALASLSGCPAISLPLPDGAGLQLVGAPGSDLRLIELAEVMMAVLDA